MYFSENKGPLPSYSSSLRCKGKFLTVHYKHWLQLYSRLQNTVLPQLLRDQRQSSILLQHRVPICCTGHHSDRGAHVYGCETMREIYYADAFCMVSQDSYPWLNLTLTDLSRVSGQNCANIYNHSFTPPSSHTPVGWPNNLKFALTTEHVWNAFTLHALLRDCALRNVRLVLSDLGTQDERLKLAMEQRNDRMLRDGLQHRMHACQVCEKMLPGTGYNGLSEYFHSLHVSSLTDYNLDRAVPWCCL